MYQSEKFDFDGKEYEIRVTSDGFTTYIRAFQNGIPANGYGYQVSLEVQFDAKMTGSIINPVEEMINTAKHDVREKTWERYLKALEELKNSEKA